VDIFHTACDIIFTALESGYYPTRSKTLLSAIEWAELSSACIAAIGRGYCRTENSSREDDIKEAWSQAYDSACGDVENHPFSNAFSWIIATADQLSLNLTVDENESSIISWIMQSERKSSSVWRDSLLPKWKRLFWPGRWTKLNAVPPLLKLTSSMPSLNATLTYSTKQHSPLGLTLPRPPFPAAPH
jgi:hypothetical protein